MPDTDILVKIESVISEVLGRTVGPLDRDMTAETIAGWDSLSHIQIVVGLERLFGIRFSAAELIDYQNIGALEDGIAKKLAQEAT